MRYFATRSLTEPVGLTISSLAKIRTAGFGRHPRDLDERRVADRIEDVRRTGRRAGRASVVRMAMIVGGLVDPPTGRP